MKQTIKPTKEEIQAMTIKSLEEKIQNALDIIHNYGGYGGDHHKQWCLNLIVKELAGDSGYQQWVREYCDGEDGPHTYIWGIGIAP